MLGVCLYASAGLRLLGLEPQPSGFQARIGTPLLELAGAVLPHVRDGDPAAAFATLEPWLNKRMSEGNALGDAGR